MPNITRSFRKSKPGSFLPVILAVTTLMMIFGMAILTLMSANLKRVALYDRQVSATNIAEAGLNYYLWHLAHNPNDYTDNHSGAAPNADGSYGPYNHPYNDTSGHEIGSFDLYIFPPDINSASVKVKSVGKLTNLSLEKNIVAQLGMPYFSKFYLLSFNDEIWIGNSETVNGPVQTNNPNKGIRNDGSVGQTSATCISSYISDTDGHSHPCIWGNGTFQGGKVNPVQPFNIADVDFNQLQTSASPDGTYYPENTSGVGYHIILKGDRYDIKKVVSTNSHRGYYVGDHNQSNIFDEIRSETSYLTDQPFPSNGLIFISDHFWIEGTLQDKKVTFVAAKTTEPNPSKFKSVYINNNISYVAHNSSTKLGLVAQKGIQIVYGAPSTLNIDAAMLAKNDYVFFPDYNGNIKNTISVFGSIAHKGGLIFTWVSGSTVVSGYRTTVNNHDSDLIYSPPPFFPKSGQYQILNWHEE